MERRYLFLTLSQWRTGIIISISAAAAVAAFTFFISMWLPVTVFLVCLTIFHMTQASHFIVPFPHIAILISALQYVLAAWLGVYYPPDNPVYDIGADLPRYLGYTGPLLVAVCVGWSLSLIRLKPKIAPSVPIDGR